MRVLFLNTGTGRNLGDRAMLLNVVRLARSQHPDAILRVSSDVPSWIVKEFNLHPTPALIHLWGRWASIASRLGLRAKWARTLAPAYQILCTITCLILIKMPLPIRRRIPGMEGSLINAVATTDLAYFTGGGYLTDTGSTEARAVLLTALMARLRGARIVMTGQGVGPFSSLWTQWLARQVAARCDILVTREADAAAYWFDRWRLPPSCWEGGVDDACSLPHGPADPAAHSKSLAINFRISPFHVGAEGLADGFLEIIRFHLSAGYQVKLFVFQEHSETEIEPYTRWLKILQSDAVSIVRDSDPRIIRAELESCERAIGLAYHFLLFTLMSGMPAVAVYSNEYYQTKFAGLATLFEQPECLLSTADFSASVVVKRFETMGAAPGWQRPAPAAAEHALACDRQILSALHAAADSSFAERAAVPCPRETGIHEEAFVHED